MFSNKQKVGSMGFEERLTKSQKAIKRFDDWCDRNDIAYAKSGYEELISNKPEEFKKLIQNINTETAKRIRFFPDRIVALQDVTLIEIKNSKTIEKDAYETYVNLNNIKYKVGVVILHAYILSFVLIKQLIIKEVNEHNTPIIWRYNIPVIDNIWIAPRLLSKKKYSEWKQESGGSGTAYGIIDFNNTPFGILE